MNRDAPVAQLDRALPSEGKGHTFESCRVRQFLNGFTSRRRDPPTRSKADRMLSFETIIRIVRSETTIRPMMAPRYAFRPAKAGLPWSTMNSWG
jgi:hypothetical protein